MNHHLKASGATCHWGFFDAKLKPALTIQSGDTVTVDTVTGGPEAHPKPGSGFTTPPEIADVHANAEKTLPGHILTGPIAVAGAKPGQVLEVRIEDVELRQDWGYNVVRPLAGALPDDFHEFRLLHVPLDLKAKTGRLPWGLELPLAPFFGVMGTAPPPNWGRVTSIVPRAFGGNIDNKELVAGACRAMARCASPRLKLRCRVASLSSCERTSRSPIRAPKPPRTTSRWVWTLIWIAASKQRCAT